jgi:hypothetical protein
LRAKATAFDACASAAGAFRCCTIELRYMMAKQW